MPVTRVDHHNCVTSYHILY